MASKGFWMSPKTRTLIPVSWKTVSAMCQMYRRTDRNTNMCNIWHPSLIISVIMMIPMLIDGFTQRLTTYESTNIRRFITGFLFGIGLTSLFLLSVSYTFSNGYKYGNEIGKAVNYSAIKLPSI